MQTTTISITTDIKVKDKAQKTARELGTNLSVIMSSFLKQFVKTKSTTLDPYDGEEPNEHTKAIFKQAEENLRKGNHSPVFDTGEEAVAWLEKQGI